MIPITRGPEPDVLIRHGARWMSELCAARQDWHRRDKLFRTGLSAVEPGDKPKAQGSRYAHAQVKEALSDPAMFGGKCCYCEGAVAATSYPHVEHFRPQSIYPALAHKWSNLLQACGRCNGAPYKSDQFPLIPHGRTLTENRQNPCARDDSDAPFLLNPCDEDPALHLTFSGARVVALSSRGAKTRKVCGLQREELLDDRRQNLQAVRTAIAAFLNAHQRKEANEAKRYRITLRMLVHSNSRYAGMARAEVRRHNLDWTKL